MTYGQNLEKLLSKAQLDSVNSGHPVMIKLDKSNCSYFDNFQGQVKAIKEAGKIYFNFVDTVSRYDKTGKINAQITHDKNGEMQTYQEFDSEGRIVYDCAYSLKIIGGLTYRLEHLRIYYGPTVLWQEGNRYLKVRNQKGPLTAASQHKFGTWTYYTRDGKIEKTKEFGEIK